MKSTLFVAAAGVILAGLMAFGQNAGQPGTTAQGRGRGGAPHAWGDKNGDGVCDFTGKAVGQGRGRMMARGDQMGRGMGRGMGGGINCPLRQNTQAPAVQPAPSPAK